MLHGEVIESIKAAFVPDLPLSFQFRELPPTQDGDSFEMVHGEKSAGFVVRGEIGWKSLALYLEPQAFSASLVQHLQRIISEDRNAVETAVQSAGALRGTVHAVLDGVRYKLQSIPVPHPACRTAAIQVDFGPMDVRGDSKQIVPETVSSCVRCFSAILRLLLPLDVIDEVIAPDDPLYGVPEGARSTVELDRYERSRANREACLRIHGARCVACGFDFGVTYGREGEGYIQVHHIVPLSQHQVSILVDPRTDLVPLCGNCHFMVHRRTPPYSVDEIRVMLQFRR